MTVETTTESPVSLLVLFDALCASGAGAQAGDGLPPCTGDGSVMRATGSLFMDDGVSPMNDSDAGACILKTSAHYTISNSTGSLSFHVSNSYSKCRLGSLKLGKVTFLGVAHSGKKHSAQATLHHSTSSGQKSQQHVAAEYDDGDLSLVVDMGQLEVNLDGNALLSWQFEQ